MQLKQIARDALLKPLQAVSGIVERRHTLPILANVLLEQRDGSLYVTATDLGRRHGARVRGALRGGHARRSTAAVAGASVSDVTREPSGATYAQPSRTFRVAVEGLTTTVPPV